MRNEEDFSKNESGIEEEENAQEFIRKISIEENKTNESE